MKASKKLLAVVVAMMMMLTLMSSIGFVFAADNLALGATATQDPNGENRDPAHGPDTAIDGNVATNWAGNAQIADGNTPPFENNQVKGDTWLALDLGVAKEIDSATIIWGEHTAEQSTRGYWLETSADGVTFTKIADAAYSYGIANLEAKTTTDTVTFPKVTIRYVRLWIVFSASKDGPSVAELELYKNGAAPLDYGALDAKIAIAKGIDEEGVESGYAELQLAITAAEAVRSTATLQSELDQAVIDLATAIAAVKYEGLPVGTHLAVIGDTQYLVGIDAGKKPSDYVGLSFKDKQGTALNADARIGTGYTVSISDVDVKIIVMGDVDGDGIIGSVDYSRTRKAYIGTYELEGEYLYAANVDISTGEELLSSVDAMRIRKAYLGLLDLDLYYPAALPQ